MHNLSFYSSNYFWLLRVASRNDLVPPLRIWSSRELPCDETRNPPEPVPSVFCLFASTRALGIGAVVRSR